MMNRLVKLIKNKKISIPVGVLILIVIILISRGGEEIQVHTIVKDDFIQTTRVSGKVVPQDEASLSFNTSGKVSEVFVKVGDEVRRGDILATLDRDDLNASLNEAQANLQLEQSQYRELQRGTRDEEIVVQEVRVESAREDYEASLSVLVDAINQTYTSADTLYTNGISQVFRDPFGFNSKILPIMNVSRQTTINEQYQDIISIMRKWSKLNSTLNADTYNTSVLRTVQEYLNTLKLFSSLVSSAVADFEPVYSTTQEEIDGYRSDLASERSALDTAIATLTNASKEYDSSANDLRFEESNLALLKAGSTSGNLDVQSARIAASSARVSSASSDIRDSQIIAPFDGTVAKKTISVGEYADSQTEVFVLIAPNGIEIESFIPELLIRNVGLDDKATITFDAYPDRKFEGVVSSVDPKDTLRDGVTTYKTSIQLINIDETPVRIGMTVDINIEAYKEENILLIPSRAIVREDGIDYVFLENKKEKREVVVGERDSNGNKAIVSGLVEGDVVVIDPANQ